MKVLLVGAGELGSRHLQSLVKLDKVDSVLVIEPNEFCRKRAEERWAEVGGRNKVELQFTELKERGNLTKIDFCIVATPSAGRCEIVLKLIDVGVKRILIEKVAFSSILQYRLVMEKAQENNVDVYINHIYRYASVYQQIKSALSGIDFKMTINSGNIGMGCNLIHFIDLFSFISGEDPNEMVINIDEPYLECKRGSEYIEFTGDTILSTKQGNIFNATFTIEHNLAPLITFETFRGEKMVINERTGETSNNFDNLSLSNFYIPRVSELTSVIIEEVLGGKCLLPNLKDSFETNKLMLNSINSSVYGKINDETTCPIT